MGISQHLTGDSNKFYGVSLSKYEAITIWQIWFFGAFSKSANT